MFSEDPDNRFLEVTYANGEKEELYFKDFSSGAMIENIVRRAKKTAIKRAIAGEPKGVNSDDLIDAIHQEYKENEDLPNTTNPDDWARISGKKGERIVYIRTLVGEHERTAKGTVRSSGFRQASTSRGTRHQLTAWLFRRSAASRPSTASPSATPADSTRSSRRRS